jgi:hypothetical protein
VLGASGPPTGTSPGGASAAGVAASPAASTLPLGRWLPPHPAAISHSASPILLMMSNGLLLNMAPMIVARICNAIAIDEYNTA